MEGRICKRSTRMGGRSEPFSGRGAVRQKFVKPAKEGCERASSGGRGIFGISINGPIDKAVESENRNSLKTYIIINTSSHQEA